MTQIDHPITMTVSTLENEKKTLYPLVIALFFSYLTISAPLAVIPLYVHDQLNLNNFWVGIAVGTQFVATVLTRPYAGRIADQISAKRATLQGMVSLLVAGVIYIIVFFLPLPIVFKFILLLVGRLVHGYAESLLVSGHLTWGLGLVGQKKAGKLLSFTGMSMFGALAAGAPLGLWLYESYGFYAVALLIVALPLISLVIDLFIRATQPHTGTYPPLKQVIQYVWRFGLVLALQGVGFACIGTFVALYFKQQQWAYAGYALTFFGLAFVAVRIFCGHLTDKVSGFKLVKYSLMIEAIGLFLLFVSPRVEVALLGAVVTGAGCSLIYPALGVELIKGAPAQIRGTAMGVFSACQDIAYAIYAPIFGLVALYLGYPFVFIVAAFCALLGCLINIYTRKFAQQTQINP
ncbi:MFS transporter [Acinetobacter guerrae]|uniref:MFS transporter n=1 Tax=Acinetobacter guerrae TaxID=1843371 RepID=UPI00128BE191|nr:MFS transporter [Acinetobacter guerrae]MPW43905.1 arabinose transporter [Acinetobacter guerrae]